MSALRRSNNENMLITINLIAYLTEKFNDTSARNPVKEILLKLNLPDHRIFKDGCEGTRFQLTHKDS
ncbi:hypothetical protein Tco_0915025 [Tanacetum coccineum]